jgi:putative molybdopterin biosynthesis protein
MKSIHKDIHNHIVIMGSNDFTIDLLSNELSARYPDFSLSLSNVGSAQGLIALNRGMCHMASCHLLDPETGTYNMPFLTRYLKGKHVKLINLVYRDLGLIVKMGNPLNIKTINDLTQPSVKIINRQQGSGTRTFFEAELKRQGINPKNINGYNNEVMTHAELAIAIMGGNADAGIGILQAAKMLGLTFIHLTKERFDLVIPEEYLSAKPIEALLNLIGSAEFKNKIKMMDGYETTDTGKEMKTA